MARTPGSSPCPWWCKWCACRWCRIWCVSWSRSCSSSPWTGWSRAGRMRWFSTRMEMGTTVWATWKLAGEMIVLALRLNIVRVGRRSFGASFQFAVFFCHKMHLLCTAPATQPAAEYFWHHTRTGTRETSARLWVVGRFPAHETWSPCHCCPPTTSAANNDTIFT